MLKYVTFLCALVFAGVRAETGEATMVFESSFGDKDALAEWAVSDAQRAGIVDMESGRALRVESAGRGVTAQILLPVEQLRGKRVRIEARVKAENVSLPPQPWNGIKVMLSTTGPSHNEYPQAAIEIGSFEWTEVGFTVRIPPDTTRARLVLGIEEATGTAWFRDVTVKLVKLPESKMVVDRTAPVFKGHDLPRLRGAMIPTLATERDLRDLAVLGANHVRWQLTWNTFPFSPADTATAEEYDAWLEETLSHVDGLLPLCHELGLRVLIDVHTPPGGINERKTMRLFGEGVFQDSLIRNWEKIARRYKDNPAVWGYDLLNEPLEGPVGEGLMDWGELAGEVTRRIRGIDPERAIIVEAGPGGSARALADFIPLPYPNMVYSFHFYVPHEFTHQGVYTPLGSGVSYPGETGGKMWDKQALREILQRVAEWQREHHVHIYVGEFSAIRWAPGNSAYRYLKDSIELFEEYEWDWAYHAFREWQGWSVEHGTDKSNEEANSVPGDRMELLKKWFQKNE